ncbi:hypothetical protein, partial [Mesorhizobium sp. B2-8-3]|uniref:hypothetical protein n=1 Tax=Mesorhizobium sp. B2-8-3 TaxID=2589905 RepID=UPI001AEDF2AF
MRALVGLSKAGCLPIPVMRPAFSFVDPVDRNGGAKLPFKTWYLEFVLARYPVHVPEVDASKAVQKPNLVPRFIHKHPQFGLRSDPESSKSFQEPQPQVSGSVPDTWVTVYTGDMGNTFGPKGFW